MLFEFDNNCLQLFFVIHLDIQLQFRLQRGHFISLGTIELADSLHSISSSIFFFIRQGGAWKSTYFKIEITHSLTHN